jgi:peptidoglycan/LPS O-acetylase OafA/YrhL
MGMLSYRLMATHSDFFRKNYYLYLMILLITLVLMNTKVIIEKFPILYGNEYYLTGILLTILLTFTLPFLFLQIKSKSDTFVGDLSYLVYIWHYAFVTIFRALNVSYDFFYPVLALTLIHAFLTKMLVADRIEKMRHKRYKKSFNA